MLLGDRLRSLREKKGLKQTEFAERMQIPNQNVSNYERGFRQPDYETLKRFADFFEVTTDYLLGHESNEGSLDYYKNKIATEFPDIDLMFKDMESLDAEEMKEVYEYIKFKVSQKKQ